MKSAMPTWIAVAAGGALGSLARHAVNVWITRAVGTAVPFATAVVNVAGCAAIGALAAMVATGQFKLSDAGRAFVFVGILGGFTTFSSLGLDTLTLTRDGAWMAALGNVVAQVVVGFGSLFVVYWALK